MESPGEYLKRERELRGVSLQEISEKLRLSVRRLERLEKDDYERLPHPTYVRGFIRSYCRELGLDENDAVLRFEAYLKEQSKKEKDSVPEHEEGLQRPLRISGRPLNWPPGTQSHTAVSARHTINST